MHHGQVCDISVGTFLCMWSQEDSPVDWLNYGDGSFGHRVRVVLFGFSIRKFFNSFTIYKRVVGKDFETLVFCDLMILAVSA